MLLHTNNPAEIAALDAQQREWLYCGLDAAVTRQVLDRQLEKLADDRFATLNYAFNRALQNIAFAMQVRGFRVDEPARKKLLKTLFDEGQAKQQEVNKLAMALTRDEKPVFRYAKGLPPPPGQLMSFFYNRLGFRAIKNKKGQRTTDKDALQRLAKQHPETARLCRAIQELRDTEKQSEVLKTGLSADGRVRSQFNPGQAETDRWTSNSDPYREGMNLMNVDSRLRGIIIPDPGYEFVEVDLEQAESRCVAYLADDEDYIAAHEAGNTHVRAARIFWPELPIPANDVEAKKFLKATPVPWVVQMPGGEVAKSYYDVCKNRQHGFNYGRTARSVAIMEGVRVAEGQRGLDAHFGAFPGIPRWHEATRRTLVERGVSITPLGFKRQFFGPPRDQHTIKEALANDPQSMCAQVLNVGLWRVWRELDDGRNFLLLQQNYDSFVAQVRKGFVRVGGEFVVDRTDSEPSLVSSCKWYEGKIRELMKVPVVVGKRTMTIPCSIQWKERWS